jgi:hypothetical protein
MDFPKQEFPQALAMVDPQKPDDHVLHPLGWLEALF